MKRTHHAIKCLALTCLLTATTAHAEWNFETDFNDDYPDGTEVYGTTVVEWIDDDAEDGARANSHVLVPWQSATPLPLQLQLHHLVDRDENGRSFIMSAQLSRAHRS